MWPIYTSSEMRELDKWAENSLGIPSILLMENASRSLFEKINNLLITNKSSLINIVFICGKGNNGGDGFALARHLILNSNKETRITIYTEKEETSFSSDAVTNLRILWKIIEAGFNLEIKYFDETYFELENADYIIDALFGTGFKGNLDKKYADIICKANDSEAIRISIDIPSGLNGDTGNSTLAFKADYTFTLAGEKLGLYLSSGKNYCGKIEILSIGIAPDECEIIYPKHFILTEEDIKEELKITNETIHKYQAGKVAVIGGSYKYPGAPLFSLNAAYKCGAGATYLFTPYINRNYALSRIDSSLLISLNTENTISKNDLLEHASTLDNADYFLIGPGMDREVNLIETIKYILSFNKLTVIDADGIYSLKHYLNEVDLTKVILTPHLGEFANLIDLSVDELKKDLISYGSSFVKKYNCILVLKSNITIIFEKNGDEVFSYLNITGNKGLAKFGSGDVLSGIILGLLPKYGKPINTVQSAVFLLGYIADQIKEQQSEFDVTPDNIINKIPYYLDLLIEDFI